MAFRKTTQNQERRNFHEFYVTLKSDLVVISVHSDKCLIEGRLVKSTVPFCNFHNRLEKQLSFDGKLCTSMFSIWERTNEKGCFVNRWYIFIAVITDENNVYKNLEEKQSRGKAAYWQCEIYTTVKQNQPLSFVRSYAPTSTTTISYLWLTNMMYVFRDYRPVHFDSYMCIVLPPELT